MMVMVATIALMLALVLALASLHSANVRGIRSWAWAELCFGISFALAYTPFFQENSWVVAAPTTLVALGFYLQGVGLKRFCGQRPRKFWAWLVVGTFAVFNAYFVLKNFDMSMRMIANAFAYGVINLNSAFALLRQPDSPLRTALRFTGGIFMFQAALLLAGSVYLAWTPVESYGMYSQIAINPAIFLGVSLLQLSLVFGFVLMMHYRIANELQQLAGRDSLTGALNRRKLTEEFERLKALYARSEEVLSVMMIDIDHFKSINDKHGHLIGDDVLRSLATLAMATIREQDAFARYGGEEFCILLPATTEWDALALAERLRTAYAKTSMRHPTSPWFSSISIGVADSGQAGLDFSTLIAASDQALYHAKQNGRNRVTAFSQLNLNSGGQMSLYPKNTPHAVS